MRDQIDPVRKKAINAIAQSHPATTQIVPTPVAANAPSCDSMRLRRAATAMAPETTIPSTTRWRSKV